MAVKLKRAGTLLLLIQAVAVRTSLVATDVFGLRTQLSEALLDTSNAEDDDSLNWAVSVATAADKQNPASAFLDFMDRLEKEFDPPSSVNIRQHALAGLELAELHSPGVESALRISDSSKIKNVLAYLTLVSHDYRAIAEQGKQLESHIILLEDVYEIIKKKQPGLVAAGNLLRSILPVSAFSPRFQEIALRINALSLDGVAAGLQAWVSSKVTDEVREAWVKLGITDPTNKVEYDKQINGGWDQLDALTILSHAFGKSLRSLEIAEAQTLRSACDGIKTAMEKSSRDDKTAVVELTGIDVLAVQKVGRARELVAFRDFLLDQYTAVAEHSVQVVNMNQQMYVRTLMGSIRSSEGEGSSTRLSAEPLVHALEEVPSAEYTVLCAVVKTLRRVVESLLKDWREERALVANAGTKLNDHFSEVASMLGRKDSWQSRAWKQVTEVGSRWYDQAYKWLTGKEIRADSDANIPKRIVADFGAHQNRITVKVLRAAGAIAERLVGNIPEGVSRLRAAMSAAAVVEYPLFTRLANLVAVAAAWGAKLPLLQEVLAELEFFEAFAPVASAIKEKKTKNPGLANELYASLPRFDAGRWPSPVSADSDKARYAETLADALTDPDQYAYWVKNHAECVKLQLPKLFYASLAERAAKQPESCALRYLLFTSSCELLNADHSRGPNKESVDRFDRAVDLVVEAMGTKQERFAEYIAAAEKLVGWFWLVTPSYEDATEFMLKYRISKFSIVGRVIVEGTARRCQQNMKHICSSILSRTEMCKAYNIGDTYLDPHAMLKIHALSNPIVYYIMLLSAVPSSRVLTWNIAGEMRKPMYDSLPHNLPGNEAAALDPLSLYLCHRGSEAKCGEFKDKLTRAQKLFDNDNVGFLSGVEAAWKTLRKLYGGSTEFPDFQEEDRRDMAFFKGVAELDPTPWFVEGRRLQDGLLVVMYEFYMAGVLEWPLFHRILDKCEVSAQNLEGVVREEFSLFIYLRPFLEKVHMHCRYGPGYCPSLYNQYVSFPPEKNGDLMHYAATFVSNWPWPKQTYPMAQGMSVHSSTDPLMPRPEDPDFRSALQPEADLPSIPIHWVRMSEVLEAAYGKAELFGSINPEQFVQGYLGDCWLVAALSSAAEYPEFVKTELFETKQDNERGVYVVNIFDGVTLTKITVNDLIPCIWNDGTFKPVFITPTGNSMWAVLYEKAFAKLRGGYGNLEGGYATEAFNSFSPGPSLTFRKSSRLSQPFFKIEPVWFYGASPTNIKLLKSFISVGFLIAASVSGNRGGNPLDEGWTGLFALHEYAVLKISEIKVPDKGPVQLIKLRNPHGRNEWKQEWSDFSKEWNEEYLEQLNHKLNPEDGVFWMPLERFLQYFDTIDVSCNILQTTCPRKPILASP